MCLFKDEDEVSEEGDGQDIEHILWWAFGRS
jgi:hypothetical protein